VAGTALGHLSRFERYHPNTLNRCQRLKYFAVPTYFGALSCAHLCQHKPCFSYYLAYCHYDPSFLTFQRADGCLNAGRKLYVFYHDGTPEAHRPSCEAEAGTKIPIVGYIPRYFSFQRLTYFASLVSVCNDIHLDMGYTFDTSLP
jgi:hypothetical protein